MQISRNFKSLTVIFLGVLSVGGCSKLDDMHDKTMQMADTTQKMATQTDRIENKSSYTYSDLRKSNSFNARKIARDCVTNSPDLPTKLGCAKVYFLAFEFQAWKDDDTDDANKLDIMKDEAAEEFFQFLTPEWAPSSLLENLEPLDPHTLNLYAYGAAIHEIDRDQITQGNLKGFTAISLLDIVEEGLRIEHKNPAHDPNAVPKVWYYDGVFKRNAIELMRRRITFMPLLAHAFLNHIETKSPMGLMFDSIFHKTFVVNPDADTTDLFDFIGLIIRRALMSRHFLNEIDLDATPQDSLYANLNVHETFKRMKINWESSPSDAAVSLKQNQLKRFQSWVELLYGSKADFIKVDPSNYIIPPDTK